LLRRGAACASRKGEANQAKAGSIGCVYKLMSSRKKAGIQENARQEPRKIHNVCKTQKSTQKKERIVHRLLAALVHELASFIH
jgi:hypothetical protein